MNCPRCDAEALTFQLFYNDPRELEVYCDPFLGGCQLYRVCNLWLTDEDIERFTRKASKVAKPCAECGGYYPGDCTCGEGCMCDGCLVENESEWDEE